MLIKQRIRHLLGGVSESPKWQRAAEQLEEMVNAMASPIRGLIKRPALGSVAQISAAALSGATIHTVEIIGEGRFHLVLPGDGTVLAFNADTGASVVVEDQMGDAAYFTGASPFRLVTVGETTYAVNPAVTVESLASQFPAADITRQKSIAWFRSVILDQPYTLLINGTSYTHTVNSADVPGAGSTEDFAEAWYDYLSVTVPGLVISRQGSVIVLSMVDSSEIRVEGGDPLGGEALTVINGTARNVADLPPQCPEIVDVTITGTDGDVDDFYVSWADHQRRWVEIRRGGLDIHHQLSGETMPHLIEWTGAGFRIKDTSSNFSNHWRERQAGDEESNPLPSFIGQKITEVFYEQGRLGVLAGNRIVLSRAGDPRSFWRNTVRVYRDDAPIDVESTLHGTTSLHSALAWDGALYFISTQGQFLFSGSPSLTPRSARLDRISDYRTTDRFRPETSGPRMYLARSVEGSTQVVAWEPRRDRPAGAANLTEGVPSYLAGAPVALAVDDTLGFLAVATDADPSVLYVCNYRFREDGVLLHTAWSRWTLPAGVTVVDLQMHDGELAAVLTNGSGTHLATMEVRKALSKAGGAGPVGLDLGTTSYTFTAKLNPLYFRDEEGQPETHGRLQVRFVDILYGPTTALTITVDSPAGSRQADVPSGTAREGKIRLPVFAEGPKTTITLTCPGTDNCAVSGLDWEGFYNDRSQRV